MKTTDDAELKTQIDRLAEIAVKGTGRKKSELLKVVEDEAKSKTILDEIETQTDEAKTEQDEAVKSAMAEGNKKAIGELGKALKAVGFTEKIEKIDKGFAEKLKTHFEGDKEPVDKSKQNEELVRLRDRVKALEQEKSDMEQSHQDALTAKDAEVAQQKTQFAVRQKALDMLKGSKAVIPDDQALAERKQAKLLRDVDGNWEEDRGEFYLLDKDGKRAKENGKPVKLSEVVAESIPTYYSIRTADDKEPGDLNKTDGAAKAGHNGFKFEKYKGPVPKDEAEYLQKLNDWNIPADQRKEIADYFGTDPKFESKAA